MGEGLKYYYHIDDDKQSQIRAFQKLFQKSAEAKLGGNFFCIVCCSSYAQGLLFCKTYLLCCLQIFS